MPVCKHCGLEKAEKDFLRNKWSEAMNGRSSYCRACGKDPAVKLLARRERKRDWCYRDDAVYMAHLARLAQRPDPAVVRDRRRLALVKAERLVLYSRLKAVCARCGVEKPLVDYPKVKHNEYDHSVTCSECWDRDPDKVRELQRERVRAYDRAMRWGSGTKEGERGDEAMRRAYQERREWEALMRSRPAEYTRAEWAALGKVGRIAVYAEQKGDRE